MNAETALASVVGTRPQFVKAAMTIRGLDERGFPQRLIHTGQHYDREMDEVFFEDLDIPRPDVNLGVGSASPSRQTGAMMDALEAYLMESGWTPDAMVVFGDTNSTLAAALVAAQHQIPLVHVEAGLRSYDRSMPEEVNRLLTDDLSDVLCAPTPRAVRQLAEEGIEKGVYRTGDVMRDAVLTYRQRAEDRYPVERVAGHPAGSYVLATVHRARNTDQLDRLEAIMDGLGRLERPVVLPAHPRTRERLEEIAVPANVKVRAPVRYLKMLTLLGGARAVCTDSGGLQREAYWCRVPCATLRPETEWPETTEGGWNRIVDVDPEALVRAVEELPDRSEPSGFGVPPRGETAYACVVEAMVEELELAGADA